MFQGFQSGPTISMSPGSSPQYLNSSLTAFSLSCSCPLGALIRSSTQPCIDLSLSYDCGSLAEAIVCFSFSSSVKLQQASAWTQDDRYIKNPIFPWKSIFYYTIGPQNEYIPLDMMLIYILYLGCSGNICTKDEKTAEEVGRLRRPTSSVVLRS